MEWSCLLSFSYRPKQETNKSRNRQGEHMDPSARLTFTAWPIPFDARLEISVSLATRARYSVSTRSRETPDAASMRSTSSFKAQALETPDFDASTKAPASDSARLASSTSLLRNEEHNASRQRVGKTTAKDSRFLRRCLLLSARARRQGRRRSAQLPVLQRWSSVHVVGLSAPK